MSDIYWFLTLLVVGYIFGTRTEKSHFKSLVEREARMRSLPVLSTDIGYDSEVVVESKLVHGNFSVGPDYFRVVVAGIINFFGGRIGVYENLMDRARREAILRMIESAGNPDMIVNLRIETFVLDAGVSKKRRWITSIDALAYGTAIKFQSKAA